MAIETIVWSCQKRDGEQMNVRFLGSMGSDGSKCKGRKECSLFSFNEILLGDYRSGSCLLVLQEKKRSESIIEL